MKFFLVTLLSLFSLSAFARTEVECSGRTGASQVVLAVEEGFGPGFRRAIAKVTHSTGAEELRTYSVYGRGAFGNRIRYEGAGFDLEVDFWPDQRPQWARTYRGNFSTTELNIPFTMVWCRFPNVRP